MVKHFVWFYLLIAVYDFWLATQTHIVWIKIVDIIGSLIWLVASIILYIKLFRKSRK